MDSSLGNILRKEMIADDIIMMLSFNSPRKLTRRLMLRLIVLT